MKIYLDDTRFPSDTYKSKGWITCRSVEQAMRLLRLGGITHVSLDGDLGSDEKGGELPGGVELLAWMVATKTWPTDQVLVHSANGPKHTDMLRMIERHFVVTGGYEEC
jgi:hypothetical protein